MLGAKQQFGHIIWFHNIHYANRDSASARSLSVAFQTRYVGHMTTLDIARPTPKERLDLIGELWDSVAPEDVRLAPAQEAELARRMATFESDASAAVSWETIEAELARKSR